MSERMSFTSEYIYCDEDYKSLRSLFEKDGDSKYLCLAPVAKWSNGIEVFEMPIIQGKLGEMNHIPCCWYIVDMLDGFRTKHEVKFVVINDSFGGVTIIKKSPEGKLKILSISEEQIDDEENDWL